MNKVIFSADMSLPKEMKYMTSSDNDDLEQLSNRLTQDLRAHIRYLNDYPIFSVEWNQMAQGLGRIGNICEMEAKMPKKHENETLWDGEEIALRYILEDGKLNLCLRELVKFQEFMATGRSETVQVANAKELLTTFETGLVLLLKNAWLHCEAIQTTDIHLLVKYISSVMDLSCNRPDLVSQKKFQHSSELMIVYFIMGLMKWIDDLGESRVMPLMIEHDIFMKLVRHIDHFGSKFQDKDMDTAAQALSMICDTEDFQANPESYVGSERDEAQVVQVKQEFLESVIQSEKRKFRPLLDTVGDFERTGGHRK